MDDASVVDKLGIDVLLSSLVHPVKNKMVHIPMMFFI